MIEGKWQARWDADRVHRAPDFDPRPKRYVLTMFPYPSGERLHVGRWFSYIPADARARYLRMRGYNVLFPIGVDAFGLPAENAAIRRGIHPRRWTMENIEVIRRQFTSMGAMWDWSREIVTCDPEYYKWTQWFFLKMYERDLAYRMLAPVDWCPRCNTSLAREQVVGKERLCERCDTPVVKRNLEQWFLRTTAYAEQLLDFSGIEWPQAIVEAQRNWIGPSRGVEFEIPVKDHPGVSFRVFTTRPETIFGMTFCVLAPEHPLVDQLTAPDRRAEVEAYKFKAARQSDIERLFTARERDGCFVGTYAVNPMTRDMVPIYIADYVLLSYGTGAIQGMPAHDTRDFGFAQKYGLPISVVVAPPGWDGQPLQEAYLGQGALVNSGPFTGLPSSEGGQQIADEMVRRGMGERKVRFHLHDWLISRQRYWGTPIPIVYCNRCGTVPVPYDDLPLLLPDDADFQPTGESPLRSHQSFLNVACPVCRDPARRETDTMDCFVDSSWYQYRYLSPHHDEGPFDPEKGKYWLPVDHYTGGIEHATMHLLYTRFWTKVMYDLGLVDFDEPMRHFFAHGIITAPGGERLSTSRGTLVVADELVRQHGADVLRGHLMFFTPWNHGGPWSDRGIAGIARFLQRLWALVTEPAKPGKGGASGELQPRDLEYAMHATIQRVTEDVEDFHFNTAVAALMEFTNFLLRIKTTPLVRTPLWREALRTLVLLMAPICPHIAEELWVEHLGEPYSVHAQAWPAYDRAKATAEQVTLILQVNGKVRDRLQVPSGITDSEAREAALTNARVKQFIDGKRVADIFVVPGRLVNVVTR